MAVGAELRVDQTRREEGVDQRVEVDEAEAERDRDEQDECLLDRGVAPVDHHVQAVVASAEPGEGEKHLHERPQEHGPGVDVQLSVDRVRLRNAEDEAEDDHEVPGDGSERRNREVVVAVEDPDDDPGEPEQDDRREEDAGEGDREVQVASGRAEELHHPGGEQHEERGDAAETEQDQPEERRGHPPGALRLPFLQQLAEDGDEDG